MSVCLLVMFLNSGNDDKSDNDGNQIDKEKGGYANKMIRQYFFFKC